MTAAERLLTRVAGVRAAGQAKWMAKCPAHDDREPSLSIREMSDGRVLLKCYASCDTGDVLAAIGLRMSDLFDKPIAHHMTPVRRPFDATEVLIAVSHEITVSCLIAHDMGQSGRCDQEQEQRLTLAAQRLNRALGFVELPIPEEIRRIRRAEAAA